MLNNIVIIGASGAIGLEFVKQYAGLNEVKKIHAFSRRQISFDSDKIISNKIDLEDENSIKLAAEIASKDSKIDLVIIASGILHDDNIFPEKSLRDLDINKFNKIFAVNTIGPAIIAKYFLPKLNKGNQPKFVALSARVGSISDNFLGGWYSYRASKAALNMILKNCAIEAKRTIKDAIIIGLHPGTVASNLSQPFAQNVKEHKLFSPEFSVQKLIDVINNKSLVDSGKIFDFNDLEIPY